jgi:ADP-heptose:LPS heptosyltransferase
MSGAKVRVGFDRKNSAEGNIVFTNRRVPAGNPHVNRAEKYLVLARAVGGSTEPVRAVLPAWPAEAATAKALLCEAGLKRRPLIVIHPGTSEFGAFKRWPPGRFGDLARRLIRRWKAGILVTWGPRERPLAMKVASAAGRSTAISPPTRSIRELAELLRQADLFISADTGPMHIAAALGVPVVALFGPKDPVLHGPYGKDARVVRAGVECSPCSKRSCEDVKCMAGITPEMVMAVAADLLKRRAFRRPYRSYAKWHAPSSSSSRPRLARKAKKSAAPSSPKSSRRA